MAYDTHEALNDYLTYSLEQLEDMQDDVVLFMTELEERYSALFRNLCEARREANRYFQGLEIEEGARGRE